MPYYLRMRLSIIWRAATALVTASIAYAQVPTATPYVRQLDLLVTDSSYDGVWRCIDWNQDGDFYDADEVVPYYDEAVGSISLTNNPCIGVAPDGTVYLGDSSVDIILSMRDENGDGDAHDPGEHRVFFDDSNPAGIAMASIQSLHVDLLGRVFLAIANSGSTGLDEWEWGVTLFAHDLHDVKDIVYTMRYDEASARFAEFGDFVIGMRRTPADLVTELGLADGEGA